MAPLPLSAVVVASEVALTDREWLERQGYKIIKDRGDGSFEVNTPGPGIGWGFVRPSAMRVECGRLGREVLDEWTKRSPFLRALRGKRPKP